MRDSDFLSSRLPAFARSARCARSLAERLLAIFARIVIATTLVSSLCLASTARADAPTSATDALRARDSEIRAMLPPPGEAADPSLRKKLEAILTRIVDLESIAKSALGKHWDAQTPAKRKVFVETFTASFRSALGGEIEGYRNSATTFGPEDAADDIVRVPTTLTVKGEPTEVVYTMMRGDRGWRIVDITIDEVSTVENYRASFGRIIRKEGFDALIARLEKRPK